MDASLRIPPAGSNLLTPPETIAQRLQVLIGQPFGLSGKPRRDGSRLRKAVAAILMQHPLPPPADPDGYEVMPHKRKGVPRILRELLDTYIVTSGKSYNLQVWNRNPTGLAAQVRYRSGPPLRAKDVRLVLVRVDPEVQQIRAVVVVSPSYVESTFGAFGKPTVKQQLLVSPQARERVLSSTPSVEYRPDTAKVAASAVEELKTPSPNMHDLPTQGNILSLEAIRRLLLPQLLGVSIPPANTKQRGQGLETVVAGALGYDVSCSPQLAGSYPDIRSQLLEVKVQDAATIDLGRYSPQFVEDVPTCPGFTTADVRYLIALTSGVSGVIEGIVLCPGAALGELLTYVSDRSWKCQRSIPMAFFDGHDGYAVCNP